MPEDDETETAAGGDGNLDRGQCRDHVIAWQGRRALRNMAKQAHERVDDALTATLSYTGATHGLHTMVLYGECHRAAVRMILARHPLGNPHDVSFDVGRLVHRRALHFGGPPHRHHGGGVATLVLNDVDVFDDESRGVDPAPPALHLDMVLVVRVRGAGSMQALLEHEGVHSPCTPGAYEVQPVDAFVGIDGGAYLRSSAAFVRPVVTQDDGSAYAPRIAYLRSMVQLHDDMLALIDSVDRARLRACRGTRLRHQAWRARVLDQRLSLWKWYYGAYGTEGPHASLPTPQCREWYDDDYRLCVRARSADYDDVLLEVHAMDVMVSVLCRIWSFLVAQNPGKEAARWPTAPDDCYLAVGDYWVGSSDLVADVVAIFADSSDCNDEGGRRRGFDCVRDELLVWLQVPSATTTAAAAAAAAEDRSEPGPLSSPSSPPPSSHWKAVARRCQRRAASQDLE